MNQDPTTKTGLGIAKLMDYFNDGNRQSEWHDQMIAVEIEARAQVLESLKNELEHAFFNDQFLSQDSGGVGPGERVPAVRASYIEAIIWRFEHNWWAR